MQDKKNDIVIESRFKTIARGKSTITFDSHRFPAISDDVFTSDYWEQNDAIIGHALGRGVTWFVTHRGEELVLRHYYRGGMVGKFVTDRYIYSGFHKSRAHREFQLLTQLQSLELPVPEPVAIHVKRLPVFCYVSDIITLRIKHAKSLVDLLCQHAISEAEWRKVGSTIRKFHDCHVYHHDLNAHNILIDEHNNVWMIDFDQGEIRADSTTWKRENLDRLKRSFTKERQRLETYHWQDRDWISLLKGYENPL